MLLIKVPVHREYKNITLFKLEGSTDSLTGSKVSGSRSDVSKDDNGDATKRTLGSVLTRLSAIVERRAPVCYNWSFY